MQVDKSVKRSLCLPAGKENQPNDSQDVIGPFDDQSQAVKPSAEVNLLSCKRTSGNSNEYQNAEKRRKGLTKINENIDESLVVKPFKKSKDAGTKLNEKMHSLKPEVQAAKKSKKAKESKVKPALAQIKGQSKMNSYFRA